MQNNNALNDLYWLYNNSSENLKSEQSHFVKFVVIKKTKKNDIKMLCLITKISWFQK